METDKDDDRRGKNQRDRRCEHRSAQPTAAPVNPPLMIDGPEAVRDSHC